MQEVRRFYPFTPFLGARVRAPFDWRGHHFEAGTLVLLDVYGAQHDPLRWAAPEEFRPERFEGGSGGAFDFIPQGGGDPAQGHRCAGEWITMHQLALALHFLTRCIRYDVPAQDLSVDLSRHAHAPRERLHHASDPRDASAARPRPAAAERLRRAPGPGACRAGRTRCPGGGIVKIPAARPGQVPAGDLKRASTADVHVVEAQNEHG